MDAPATVMISALEHFSYCPRQCALIHVEQTYDENAYTIRGRLIHEIVDEGDATEGPDGPILRGISLWSDRLGLIGRADVVELRSTGPYPIEYKAGPPHGPHAAIQLCAQAMCLEEMLGQEVLRGALFHHATRRRVEVRIDATLRERTMLAIVGVRGLLESSTVPPAVDDARCLKCSLAGSCMPTVTSTVKLDHEWDRDLMFVGGEAEP